MGLNFAGPRDCLDESSDGDEISAAENSLWRSDELAGNGYVHENLSRHCIRYTERGVEEYTRLLLEFWWTVQQLATRGVLSLSR
jgi:hypothetical protein